MKKFLAPIGVFIMGEIGFLFAVLLWTNLGTAETNLASETAGMPFWGWAWITGTGTIRLLVYIAMQLGILFATFMAFLKTRDT